MIDAKLFNTNVENAWCPGCGNFNIQQALKEVLAELSIQPHEMILVSGIGQAAKMPHYVNTHGLNGLHGRALPQALGAHVANPSLKMLVVSGDGDTYGEGGNHFIHNIRRNLDIVHMVHNNQIYGLTKGQASPTTALGQKTTLQHEGVRLDPLNPVALAITMGASFVARTFSGDKEQLKDLLKQAFLHKGYAYIDVLQPCISFNKINTHRWYKERCYTLPNDYDPTDLGQAFMKSQEFGDEGIPTGVIYKQEKPTFMERIAHNDKPLLEVARTSEERNALFDAFL